MVHGLRSLGIEPTLVSRTAAERTPDVCRSHPEVMDSHKVIVNTTPLGMWPDVDSCPGYPTVFSLPRICAMTSYIIPTLPFMRRAAEHGAEVKNGLEMLLLQAFAAWQIWQSTNAPTTVASMI